MRVIKHFLVVKRLMKDVVTELGFSLMLSFLPLSFFRFIIHYIVYLDKSFQEKNDKRIENEVTFKTWKEQKDEKLKEIIRRKKQEEKKQQEEKAKEQEKKEIAAKVRDILIK